MCKHMVTVFSDSLLGGDLQLMSEYQYNQNMQKVIRSSAVMATNNERLQE